MVEGYRLSPQQRSLWRHVERDGAGPYRARLVAGVEGPLAVEALRRALDRALLRHEILRTRFERIAGVALPVQVIGAPAPVPLEVVDGRAAGLEGAPALVAELETRAGPPAGLTATWIDLGHGRGRLLLGVPPGLVDAASFDVLLAEILADCAGVPPAGSEPEPLQYADLAEWQNELLEGDEGAASVRAWRALGLPARPPLDLPIAGPEGGVYRPEMGTCAVVLEHASALESAALGLGLPPEHLALAAWLVLLWRRSHSEQRLIGVGFAGRSYPELERAVGLFERELPLALDLRPGESGAALARRIGERLAELAALQETFAWELAVDGAPSEPALPIGFGVDDRSRVHTAGPLSLHVLARTARVQPSVLRLVFARRPGAFDLELHHDAGRITGADADRLASELAHVLSDLAARPMAAVQELELLDQPLRLEALSLGSPPLGRRGRRRPPERRCTP